MATVREINELNVTLREEIKSLLNSGRPFISAQGYDIGVTDEGFSDGFTIIKTDEGTLYVGYGDNSGDLPVSKYSNDYDEWLEDQLDNNFSMDDYSIEDLRKVWVIEKESSEDALDNLASSILGGR